MMALMDSCLASSMNPQVLMMMTSACSGSAVSSKPLLDSEPNMTSPSTWFLLQPRLTNPIVVFRGWPERLDVVMSPSVYGTNQVLVTKNLDKRPLSQKY